MIHNISSEKNQVIVDYLQDNINIFSDKARRCFENYRYYNNSEKIRDLLISILKTRSTYKRVLKEYIQQCEFIRRIKYQEYIKEIKENPVKHVEDLMGIKLHPYQKTLLKLICERK